MPNMPDRFLHSAIRYVSTHESMQPCATEHWSDKHQYMRIPLLRECIVCSSTGRRNRRMHMMCCMVVMWLLLTLLQVPTNTVCALHCKLRRDYRTIACLFATRERATPTYLYPNLIYIPQTHSFNFALHSNRHKNAIAFWVHVLCVPHRYRLF